MSLFLSASTQSFAVHTGYSEVADAPMGDLCDDFDAHGDLRLVVGEQKAVSLVCSRSLARASKIFNAMLYGDSAESKPAGPGDWRVELPDDDPYALFYLLNIIHGRFDRVSTSISEENLREITILSDKYDLTHILRPWAESWLSTIPGGARKDNSTRIWIAWELGDFKLFSQECENLLLSSSTDSDGNLIEDFGKRLDSYLMLANLDILGKLDRLRHAALSFTTPCGSGNIGY